jgi:NADH:ubiquinone oxidoreductase subunit D
VHFRAPSFAATALAPTLCRDELIADMIAVVGSLDGVMGDVDR